MTTRTWTDANNNFVPDCDLLNPLAQDLRTSGGDVLRQISDSVVRQGGFRYHSGSCAARRLGRPAGRLANRRVRAAAAPAARALEVGFYRRWLQNFVVTDNLAQAPSDLGSFYVVAPSDSRLPNGGGYKIPDLYNANQNVASLVDKFHHQGEQLRRAVSALEFSGPQPERSAGTRLVFQGGFNLGKGVSDSCAVRAKIPELNGQATIWGNPATPAWGRRSRRSMRPTPGATLTLGWVKRMTGLGSWTIPTVDVQIAGTFRSDQARALAALYNAPNADIQPILGRSLSNSAPT
jgi:hypothetical protein